MLDFAPEGESGFGCSAICDTGEKNLVGVVLMLRFFSEPDGLDFRLGVLTIHYSNLTRHCSIARRSSRVRDVCRSAGLGKGQTLWIL